MPPHLDPWWRAAPLSVRWSKLDVWQRLLEVCQEAEPLLAVLPRPPRRVVADKGCAAHRLREAVWDMGARPAIPTKSNEPPVRCPAWIYNDRHHVENAWARLREGRAISTRHEKTPASFAGVLCFAAAVQWIKTAQALVVRCLLQTGSTSNRARKASDNQEMEPTPCHA